jgi:acetyl-CoA carboxylase biotin carboxyl carrier protein
VDLTSDDVQDILHLLDGLPFSELSLETARFRLSLRRTPAGEWAQALEVLAAPNVLPAAATRDATASDPTAAADMRAAAGATPAPDPTAAADAAAPVWPGSPGSRANELLIEVRAPLLGTFYRAPRPGAPPFVTVGSVVGPDTVVCIIETMKLMNSVSAGGSGTVAEILLANAQFAQQGTVLMRIRAEQ